MARNRKTQPIVIRFGPALKGCLVCLFIAGMAIGYVGQKNQLQVLGGQFRDLENRLGKLRRENVLRARILDSLQTPSELEARIKQMNLGLVAPQPEQIVRLVERAQPAPSETTNQLYAHRSLLTKAHD
ncbi:MAG: hypothetical protein HYY23_05560 [Verrucomicrobia bacterium]|nr:hypothetical protein [Verrucomicrobiota bacterium]